MAAKLSFLFFPLLSEKKIASADLTAAIIRVSRTVKFNCPLHRIHDKMVFERFELLLEVGHRNTI